MFEHRGFQGRFVRKAVGFTVMVALAVGAMGLVVMTLWNGLLPPLFGFKTIQFWQALGLLVLSRILVGGFPRGHGHGFRHRQRMIQRWESMTPEEREKFRQGIRGRFCPSPESRKA